MLFNLKSNSYWRWREIKCSGNNHHSKKFVCFILGIFLFSQCIEYARGTISSPIPFVEEQPDGTPTTDLVVKGGPKGYLVSDTKGYTVIEDSDTGTIVYAKRNVETGRLVNSGLIVGRDDPVKSDLQVNEEPSEKVKAQECTKLCDQDDDCTFQVFGLTLGGSNCRLRDRTVRNLRDANNTLGRDLSGEFPDDEYETASKRLLSIQSMAEGVLRNLVVLIRFSDHDDRNLPSVSAFDALMNTIGGDPKFSPTGSVRDVYLTSSYGKFDLLSTVVGWVGLPNQEAYYADGKSGTTKKYEEAMRYALDILDNHPQFSFDLYDKNNDYTIDSIMFVHSGYGAEWGKTDCYGTKAKDRIWSHKFTLTWESKNSPYRVDNYFTSPALFGTCGDEISRIGTISHELGHVLGLPDLYLGGNGIGSYGLMGNSWGFDSSQQYPPIMDAWSKIKMNWISSPQEVYRSGRYTLKNSYQHPEVIMISANFPQGEYLLIENRQKVGFDAKMPKSGLVIYHIDETASFYKNPGWYGQENWPQNGNHYRVAILQEDGKYHLENGENRGDEGDVWNSGSTRKELGPGDLQNYGLPHPNTDSYQYGKIKATGVRIFDIQEDGSDISFSVEIPGTESSTSISTAQALNAQSELGTTFMGGTGSYGNMFDIIAGDDAVIVFSLDIHCRLTPDKFPAGVPVKVYTKPGTHEGYETKKEDWTLISFSNVIPQGSVKRTVIEEENFSPVTISAGQRQAFYVTLDSPNLRYTRGKSFGGIAATNGDLMILEGTGCGSEFGKTYKPRIWNGIVKYTVVSSKVIQYGTNENKVKKNFELETSFRGRNGSYGNMFNVLARSTQVTVTGMDINVRTTDNVHVEVYTKPGEYQDHERDPTKWNLVFSESLKGNGPGKPTTLPDAQFTDVEIEKETVQAFYVTTKTNDLRYTTGGQSVSDDNIKIYDGTGIPAYPFAQGAPSLYSPRGFNGVLRYSAIVTEREKVSVKAEDELLTTFGGGNGSYGNMWTITARNNIQITGLDFHTRSVDSVALQLYMKRGSYTGAEKNLSFWTKICETSVSGMGTFARTPVPEGCFDPINLNSKESVSFYLTLSTVDIRYTAGNVNLGDLFCSNDDLELFVGSGIGSFPLTYTSKVFPGRIFNGVIKYKTSETNDKFLETTFVGGNGSFGNIVTVSAQKDLDVTSIDIHLQNLASHNIEIYTIEGSSDGHERSMDGWVKIYGGTVQGKGSKEKTQIDKSQFQKVPIKKGQKRSFYITADSPVLRYTNGNSFGNVVASDDSLAVMEGWGVGAYPLGQNTPLYKPRNFNGIFYYN